jgi:phage shock protein PspC (stress-responsive transcriptional regulator)
MVRGSATEHIGHMNTTPPPPAGEAPAPPEPEADGPRVTRDQVRDLGRLRRSVDDSKIAGVGGGIARHLDIDPIIVRVALVVLIFFGGAGLFIYAAFWLLVPEEGSMAQPLGLDDRNRSIALMGTGVLAALAAVGDWAGAFWFPWPIVIVGLVVLMVVNRSRRPRDVYRPPGPDGSPAVSAPAPYSSENPTVPPGAYAPRPPRPRNPRRRGPILFWFTLALIATAIGVLGVVDVSGVEVVGAAYPALALGITALMLVFGSFWGRAGGLILVGLVAAAATAGATAGAHWENDRVEHVPTVASDVRDSYFQGAGELFVDLSHVGNINALDGRTVQVEGGVGRIEVVVPRGMDVTVSGAVDGPGDVSIFGDHSSGFEMSDEGVVDTPGEAPEMSIDVNLGVGEIVVREQ